MDGFTEPAASTLVILPGLDGTEVFFRPFIAALPAHVRTVPVCFPDEGPYDYAALLARIRREIGSLERYCLLASSFSGPLGVMLAAAEPQRVQGLILCATFLRAPRPRFRRLRFAVRTPLVLALRVTRRLPVWLLRPRGDALREAKREIWNRVSARALAGRARAALDVDVREMLGRSRSPVFCVAYDADTTVPRRCASEILECCPAARALTLPGGHFGFFSDPQRLADEVARFMEMTPQRAV